MVVSVVCVLKSQQKNNRNLDPRNPNQKGSCRWSGMENSTEMETSSVGLESSVMENISVTVYLNFLKMMKSIAMSDDFEKKSS